MSTRGVRAAGGALLLVAAAAAVSALVRPALPLPVSAGLTALGGGFDRTLLAEVAGRAAVVVPATAAGLLLVLRAARRPALLVAGVATPIVVFLVAQLNGVTDVGALVLVYAASTGAVLLRALRTRRARIDAAMLGIVPWGIVAFQQIGASIAGQPPSPAVSATTLVVLAASIAEFAASWRAEEGTASPAVAAVAAALPAGLLALLTAALV